jgi:citrate lyase beta subunit
LARSLVEANPHQPPRQPVHTVFGGAQLFKAGVAARFQELSLEALGKFAPDADSLADAMGFERGAHAEAVYAAVRSKLEREAVEDYRIDFEDGYGVRADEEEDGHAVAAAEELVAGMKAGSLPWRTGIRVKSMSDIEHERSVRTLRLFLSSLIGGAGTVPPNFIVNLPKVRSVAEVAEFAKILAGLEKEFAIDEHALRFEIMIETPSIVLGADGRSPLPLLVEAGGTRLVAAIFGGYDFTGALGITAAHQSLRHPACEFARNMMLVALGPTRIQLSDGATAVLPIGDKDTVHAAWRVHYDNVRHAMAGGFYQGWDLHPAQLISRYAATFAFFLEGRDVAAARLKNFLAKAEQATRVGSAFDDAATGHGLINFFRLAVSCGAMTSDEAAQMIGVNAPRH